MKVPRPFAFLWMAVLVLGAGCTPIVGDACESAADCGQGLYCESSLPGGYCTRSACTSQGCPDEGICVLFDEDTSFCMLPCSGADDCRDDYLCVEDFGGHPFCHSTLPPGQQEN